MSARSDTGIWVDLSTGKLVDSPPTEGIQLVPAGGEITADVESALVAHGWTVATEVTVEPPVEVSVEPAATPVVDAPEVSVEPAPEPVAVEADPRPAPPVATSA